MNTEEWDFILGNLRDESNPEKAGQAAADLPNKVNQDDIHRFLELLNDGDFIVRETAAVALCGLVAVPFLEQILVALQKGFDDGHDNDSLQGALSDMATMNTASVKSKLNEIRIGADTKLIENIDWLLECCG
jgi:hypothetical protein